MNQIKVAWASGIFILYTFNCMIISKDRLIDYKNILKRNCVYAIKELPGNEVNDSPFERLTNIDNELNLLQTEYNKECKFLHKQLGEGLISDLSDAEKNDLVYWKNIKIGVIDYTKYKYIVRVIKD